MNCRHFPLWSAVQCSPQGRTSGIPEWQRSQSGFKMCNDSTAASNNWQPEGNLWRWSQATSPSPSFSSLLVGKVDVSVQDWNAPTLYWTTYFITFSCSRSSGAAAPGRTPTTTAVIYRMFFYFFQRPTWPSLYVRHLRSVPKGYLITRHR